MSNKSVWSIAAAMLVFVSCKDKPQQQIASALPFSVTEVPVRTVVGYDSYPAMIEGTNNSAIRAKVSGYITKVLVDEGQKVRKGQVLFTLETQAMSQDAGAALASVNAAQVEVDRLIPLVEKNIISNVQLETAKARLAQAKSNHSSIAATIDYANIRSSIDGYVGAINYREGALVSPNDPNPLTTVSTTEDVYVFFAINESQYIDFLSNTEGKTRDEKLKNFPEVELELINGTVYSEKGKIETVTGQVDKATGTVKFRAKFANPSGILANGNSGSIRIPKIYNDVVVIPETATYEQQGIDYVYRVKNDTAYATIIEIEDRINRLAIIKSGVAKGDIIVVEGIVKLRNQTPIQPNNVNFDTLVNSVKSTF
ncbi:MAG: efflux RND transporter periplasmic adaptor subunit [Flavobacteriaceae bacterium]